MEVLGTNKAHRLPAFTCARTHACTRGWRVAPLLAILVSILTIHHAGAAQQQFSESQIKAAFLIKFARFVDWPEKIVDPEQAEDAPEETFCIGVLGEDPVEAVLLELAANQTIKDNPITILHAESPDQLLDCEMAFICKSEEAEMDDILGQLNGHSVLTISDTTTFYDQGGMIYLEKTEDNRFQFRINQDAAIRVNIKMSSQLLQLAKEVKKPNEDAKLNDSNPGGGEVAAP